jgi:hypothetical protein
VISLSAFASPVHAQEAQPVVDTYAIDVNGNPKGFVTAVKKVFAKADALGLKSERHVYVSEIGGPRT